ncbi:MAG: hypothetical protein KAQ68_05830 [Clostridiales bacterium]|nr:hypothetical protein [Clostridiales bacterium]
MLYSEQDYLDITLTRKRFWFQILAVTIIFIATIIVASISRIIWIGYTGAILWAIVVVFLWGMKGSYIRKYYNFLKDLRQGLENTITGTVASIDSSKNIKELLEFYLVVFNEDNAPTDSPARKLYIDVSKGLPEYKSGTRLELVLFGNYIKGIKVL